MQYIKVQGVIDDDELVASLESREKSRKLTHQLAIRSGEFNDSLCSKGYAFVESIDEPLINIGLLVDKGDDAEKILKKFIKSIKLKIVETKCEEVTVNVITNMLSCASRGGYISDDDEIMETFGFDRIVGRWGRSFEFGDNILTPEKDEELLNKASKYLSNETLKPELENIFSVKVPAGKYGHPVLYFVETDDKDLTKDFYTMILQALYNSGRLCYRRYSYVYISRESEFSKASYESLYKTSNGSAIVVRVRMSGETENSHASSERENLSIACEMAKKYRNQVLTIFCLPRECNKLKSQLLEGLGNISYVEVKEDFAKGDAARDFLSVIAKENHIRPDKKLYAKVNEGEGYLSNQLRSIFDDWYEQKLTNIFPQYKTAQNVKKTIQKEKAKGNAFIELNEMIGLTEAKKVINQALDYYKAQKLFKDKGMKETQPSMHMVFTGNPGSAKTTCARLFAQIMKQNGVLSKGHLIELTANELKAKYVGWTGPLVKKKFQEALGGVLFLDEIDSILEGQEGSFGDEAISTIVAEMENHRDEVVCIFAGYPNEMEKFLAKNPGLRSRIAFHVPFNDYSEDELCEIAKYIAKGQGRKLSEDAITKLKSIFAQVKERDDFGNGRFCRNLIEKAKMAQASRLVTMDYDKVSKDDIETLVAEDFQYIEEEKTEKRHIGFCA